MRHLSSSKDQVLCSKLHLSHHRSCQRNRLFKNQFSWTGVLWSCQMVLTSLISEEESAKKMKMILGSSNKKPPFKIASVLQLAVNNLQVTFCQPMNPRILVVWSIRNLGSIQVRHLETGKSKRKCPQVRHRTRRKSERWIRPWKIKFGILILMKKKISTYKYLTNILSIQNKITIRSKIQNS